jgi:hypothetical protein
MSALSLFETILADVGKGIQIFTGIAPALYQSVPTAAKPTVTAVTDDLTEIGQAVASAAAVTAAIKPGATPADVATAAVPLVQNIVSASELIAGKKIQNQGLFNQATAEIAQGVTDLLNSLEAPAKPQS